MNIHTNRSKWYRGAVEKYDAKRKQIQVKVMFAHYCFKSSSSFQLFFLVQQYDDSDVSWYTMSEKTFRFVSV